MQTGRGVPIDIHADVIVVGFGPVGAALAGLLGRRGLRVTVLERDKDVFSLPRAAHVDHTGLRTWQELGALDELLPDMEPNSGLDFVTASGELLARVPSDQGNVSGLPTSMYFYQPLLDATVRAAVSALPTVDVLLGASLTETVETDGGVVARFIDDDGASRELRGSWLVACDGPSSTVRRQLDISFEDLEFEEPWLVVDLKLAADVVDVLDHAVCWCDPVRPTYSIPMPLKRHRFEFRLMPDDVPEEMVRPERILELVSRWYPEGTVEVERTAIYTFHGLVANTWRVGRILLAGDAVHQMPPFLGQGMGSGLRDATNLAWKLDDVIRGVAPESLLETYEIERREHSRALVEDAVAFGRIICVIDPEEAARRDREMLADKRPPTARLFFGLPDLERGPLILEGGGELFVQPRALPKLDDVIGPHFAVFSTDARALRGPAAGWWRDAGAHVVSIEDLEPAYARSIAKWLKNHHATSVIVRPDRYALWAGDDIESATERVAHLLEVPKVDPL